ncbi:Protein kinase domain [Carpediemonas membranifera]|uniref:Protein kinase domain n=1 Tax=Carpediemonas membranifera TaxID=201153 RepID=A0A8J6E5Q7_9EUKA|nr:Protein kinase domain [Carpediemonas membranifera]|eukprot:KAG9396142.1 Protein kinase domain [Carpediemonas membranifera]
MGNNERQLIDSLRPGDVFDDRFIVKRILGRSAVGSVFYCQDIQNSQKPVAVKAGCSRLSAILAQNEAKILIHAFSHDVKRVPRLITCKQEATCSYIVQKLLGKNLLAELKGSDGGSHVTLKHSIKIVLSMSTCLRDIHRAGIVHRNIKAGNFAFGRQSSQLYVIDFGIARLFMAEDGTVIPARKNPGFRGSVQYASINAHLNQELSPRDDYWSMVFSVLELLNGSLPWTGVSDKQTVLRMKEAMVSGKSLPTIFPAFIGELIDLLKTVRYGELVDHSIVKRILRDAMRAPDIVTDSHGDSAFPDTAEFESYSRLTPDALMSQEDEIKENLDSNKSTSSIFDSDAVFGPNSNEGETRPRSVFTSDCEDASICFHPKPSTPGSLSLPPPEVGRVVGAHRNLDAVGTLMERENVDVDGIHAPYCSRADAELGDSEEPSDSIVRRIVRVVAIFLNAVSRIVFPAVE